METPAEKYLHGFTTGEQERLYSQAQLLEEMIYSGIDFRNTNHLLEVGCGVGAQTEMLLLRFPHLKITGIDFSATQLQAAQKRLDENPKRGKQVTLQQMDAKAMTFGNHENFDGAFLCWVLEHIPEPQRVLEETKRVLQPGSTIYITEVQNATFYIEPYSPAVLHYWNCFNELQRSIGGDPFVGAKLGNLLHDCGYTNIHTEIKTFFYDNRQPQKREDMFSYCLSLLLSASENLIAAGYITTAEVEAVKKELTAAIENKDGVFYYSFVQATAQTPADLV